jgi:hypothetical protein
MVKLMLVKMTTGGRNPTSDGMVSCEGILTIQKESGAYADGISLRVYKVTTKLADHMRRNLILCDTLLFQQNVSSLIQSN